MRLFVLSSLCLVAAFAQEPAAAPRPQHQPPKNLKLLKPEEVRSAMQAFRVALGMQCTGCHVKGDFASDENPHKDIARQMIAMTREINAKISDDGKTRVTCYTCHRGAEEPATAAPAAPAAPPQAPPPPPPAQ